MTLDGGDPGGRRKVVDRGWALNEASLEKGPRLGCSTSLSRSTVARCPRSAATAFWCPTPDRLDGIRISLPAARWCGRRSKRSWWYSNNAALFARPMVTSPDSTVAVEIEASGTHRWCSAMVATWCLPAGAGTGHPQRQTGEMDPAGQCTAFTDRLVRKFRLPVTGWRGQ